MENISDKSLLLCMIGIQKKGVSGELGGITRLQKLMFLLEKEGGVPSRKSGLVFIPYKAGPYSSELYDSIEFLENMGYIQGELVGEAVKEEIDEIDALNFSDLIDSGEPGSDSYVERHFNLTSKGIDKIKKLVDDPNYRPLVDGIRKIKSKYGNYSLRDLLYYIYSKYPDMTNESEIKEKVLGKKYGKKKLFFWG